MVIATTCCGLLHYLYVYAYVYVYDMDKKVKMGFEDDVTKFFNCDFQNQNVLMHHNTEADRSKYCFLPTLI